MAVIKKNGSSMGLPMNINRGNPIPIDNTMVWYSLQEAEDYAATGATAYVGQLLSVVDEENNTTKVYVIINEVGDLIEISSSQGAEQAAARASQAATTAGNYAAQAIQAYQAIEQKIWYGTMEEYNNLETVSRSTIYIILHE